MCNVYKLMMQSLYCHLQCTVVGVVLKDSLGGTTFDGCIKSIQVVDFSKATIQGLHHQLVAIAH